MAGSLNNAADPIDSPVSDEEGDGIVPFGKPQPPQRDWRLYNVIFLGLSFMLVFTAFQTCSMVEESVLESVHTNGTGFQGSGYTSLAIIYSVFAVSNWAAPSIVTVIGPKLSMIAGAIMYCLFIASFLKIMKWSLYLGSVLVGFGAAILWTGQGNFLSLNSDRHTMGRNSGIFWALLQCSLLFGNLYVYFEFKGEVHIPDSSKTTVFIVLTSVCAAGTLCFILLRSKLYHPNDEELEPATNEGPLQAFKSSVKLLFTKEMLLLSFCFAYTGLELTFFSGVYGTSVGNNMAFGDDRKGLIGLCGIFIGVGEILGGLSFGLLGSKTNKYGRDPIVMMGFLSHSLAFYLIFLNQPADSPFNDSYGSYITPNKYLAIFCALLLGFGDSSYNTQIFSLLGDVYSDERSAPAFALFKFMQSVSAAAGFFYSPFLQLQWQLLILVVLNFVGSWSFYVVEWRTSKRDGQGYSSI